MAFTRLSARNMVSNGNVICNSPSVLQCPQVLETIGWAVFLFVFIILVWKIGRWYKQRQMAARKSEEDHRLVSLPYPQHPSEKYEDASSMKKLGPDPSTSTLVDPYLVANSFNNSLISQDYAFKRMEMPEPVLKWREPFNRSESALDLPKPMVVQPSELKLDPPTIKLHDDDDKKGSITSNFSDPRPASPPPAYIRSLR